jgi:transposase
MYLTLMWWPKRDVATKPSASKTERTTELTDEQWLLIADLFPWTPPSRRGGRPRAHPRDCLEGIVWVLRTGARWKDLPEGFSSKSTCWRRFRDWTESGVFQEAWRRLLSKLDGLGRIKWDEAFADGTFSPAKKGAHWSVPPVVARERRSWCWPTPRDCLWASTSRRPTVTKSS